MKNASSHATTVLDVALRRRLPAFTLDVAFSTSSGRTVLFGPSGAGKSLTLQALAGLFPLESAHIARGDEIWHDSSVGVFVPPQARRIGYLPQQYALFPHLTVAQNIAFGQHSRGQTARKRLLELLHLMQLEGLERARPAQLSGGQQQRVALARALAVEPDLLLLDEPWSSLDGPVRSTLREEILRFHEQFQVPLLLVTHDLLDVQTIAEYVVVIAQGKVLQSGTPEQIFRIPRTRQIATLAGIKTCWRGRIRALETVSSGQRAAIEVPDGVLNAAVPPGSAFVVGQTVEFALHTDEILLSTDPDPLARHSAAPHALIAATVVQEQARGAFHSITVSLLSLVHLEIPIPRWQRRAMELIPGSPVTLTVPDEAVHLFTTT